MGYSKVIKVSDHKIRVVHQLGQDGEPYAEDLTIETAESVDPGRLGYLAQNDGRVGIMSFSFSPVAEGAAEGMKFPGDDET